MAAARSVSSSLAVCVALLGAGSACRAPGETVAPSEAVAPAVHDPVATRQDGPAPAAAPTDHGAARERVVAALEAHRCIVDPHDAIADPQFLPALRTALLDLPADARSQALTYVAVHHVSGVATLLLAHFQRGGDDQADIVHALADLPDLPEPDVLLGFAPFGPNSDDGIYRKYFYRALLRAPDRAAALTALRAVRPRERDPLAAISADLVAMVLGGDAEKAVVTAALGNLSVEQVREVDDVAAIGHAPNLAPVFAPWLEDAREVGTFSHRETQSYRVRDLGVWAIQSLGVQVKGAPNHLTHASAAVLANAKRAIR